MLSKRAGNHTQSKLPCPAEELTLIKELIKGMESQIDCGNYEEIQGKRLAQIKAAGLGLSAIEPLLLFMERHPPSGFGMPGALSTMRNNSSKELRANM